MGVEGLNGFPGKVAFEVLNTHATGLLSSE